MQPRLSNPRTYYWGEAVEVYDEIRRPKERWRFDMAAVEKAMQGMTSVLDLPVGTGRFLPVYKKVGAEPYGVDVSEDMVRKATENGFPNCKVGDIINIPMEDQSVDAIVCIRLMIHLQPEDAYPGIQEFKRVAKKRIIIDARLGSSTTIPYRGTIMHSRKDFLRQFDGWKLNQSIGAAHYPVMAFDRAE